MVCFLQMACCVDPQGHRTYYTLTVWGHFELSLHLTSLILLPLKYHYHITTSKMLIFFIQKTHIIKNTLFNVLKCKCFPRVTTEPPPPQNDKNTYPLHDGFHGFAGLFIWPNFGLLVRIVVRGIFNIFYFGLDKLKSSRVHSKQKENFEIGNRHFLYCNICIITLCVCISHFKSTKFHSFQVSFICVAPNHSIHYLQALYSVRSRPYNITSCV